MTMVHGFPVNWSLLSLDGLRLRTEKTKRMGWRWCPFCAFWAMLPCSELFRYLLCLRCWQFFFWAGPFLQEDSHRKARCLPSLGGIYSMVNPGTHKSSRFFWEVNQFGPRKHILKAEIFVHCSNCSNPMMRREEERLPIWRLGRSWQILADLGRSWQHDMNQFLVIVIAMLATSIGPSDSTADRSCPALWFDFYGWEVIYSSTSSLEKRATNLEIFPNSLEEKCKKPSEISQVGENLGRLGT